MLRQHLHVALLFTGALAIVGCGRFPSPTPGPGAQSSAVVLVSAAGRLATSTPLRAITPILPTPIFDPGFSSLLTPLAANELQTRIAVVSTVTPPIRPTRTVAASATPFPTLEPPPKPGAPPGDPSGGFIPPPTRTPSNPTATRVPSATRTFTRTATPPPEDPSPGNTDLAHAMTISTGVDVSSLLPVPQAVDVFAFDVLVEETVIFVTLTGREIDRYRLYLISPGRQSAATGRPLGNTARQIRFPARTEKGTWYVEVATDGKKAASTAYSLRVDLRISATPVAG